VQELIHRLDRATVRGVIVDDDGGAHVELVLDLRDFHGERDVLKAVVGALTCHKGFDNAAYSVGAEPSMGNLQRHNLSLLWTGLTSSRARRERYAARGLMDTIVLHLQPGATRSLLP